MNRQILSGFRLPAAAGVVFGASYYLPLLVPNLVAFVPLLYWLDAHASTPTYVRLRGGLLFGFSAALIGLHFCFPMLEYSWLAILLYLAFAGLLAIRISLCLLLTGWLRRYTGWSWAVLLPATWLLFDWLQTFGDLRMTGDHLAHALAAYPFVIQFADLVGHYGVEAFALVVNALLYESWLGPPAGRRRATGTLIAFLVVVLAYDAWAWWRPAPPTQPTRVAVVQPNVPLLVKHGRGTEDEQRATLARLSRQAAAGGAELVVWPESARPEPLVHWVDRPETYALPEVQALAKELGVALLVGVEYARARSRDDYDLYNAAVLVDARGNVDPRWAAKVYLVPFVEATPFRSLLGPLVDGRGGEWRWLAGGFRPGPRGQVLDVAGGRLGLLVCYEQLFPDLARKLRNAGAEYLVVITNDAWYGRTPFQDYLANAARLRAIENRAEVVRVANTGISGFVDRRGRYHGRTPLFVEAVELRDVRRSGVRTVYDRLGDWVVWVALLAVLGAAWLAWRGPAPSPTAAA